VTRFILDTGIAGLYLDRKRGVFERAVAEVARGNRIGIAAPVLAELAFRAEGSPLRERNVQRLRQALDVWKLWLVDTAAAFEYGRIAFELKTIGRPMGQNDIMIAAVALALLGTPQSSRWTVTSRPCPDWPLRTGQSRSEFRP
jgi:tRNA(fMet)-specific endonuclease VapC